MIKIFIYTFKSPATIYTAKRLIKSGKIAGIILQKPLSLREKIRFIKRRIKRYGLIKIADEILFKIYYIIFLKKKDENLRKIYFPKDFFNIEINDKHIKVYEIDSINSNKGKKLIKQLKPDLVIMESREMIEKDILKMARLGFVGCHPGITPEYRGVYSSFWAMRYGEPDKVGLSVYLADKGVDTGSIISQRTSWPKFNIRHFKVESERLMIEGIKDFINAIDKTEKGLLKTYRKNSSPSRLFTHIGLSDYIKAVSKNA